MPATAPAAAKTILVADDTAFVRDRLKPAHETAGHRAATAGSRAELRAQVGAEAGRVRWRAPATRWPRVRQRGSGGGGENYNPYLRKTVDDVEPALIHTVRGFGYVLRREP